MTDASDLSRPTSGEIRYSPRAKRQDAADAMGNDLVRALVELITNCDDAYARSGRKGSIQIVAEHGRTSTGTYNRVIVRDQAGGMTPDEVERGLLVAGARASGHELGRRTRGLQGRGAKDVAVFGKATFRTVKNGTFTTLTIDGDTFDYVDRSERPATLDDYASLGLLSAEERLLRAIFGEGTSVDSPSESGATEATVFVKRSAHSVPLHRTLAGRLARHVQLRDIMADPLIDVTLAEFGKSVGPERLGYQPPYACEVVLDEQIAVPDYPATCRLVISKSEKPFEDDRSASRHGGILVVGRRAIYDATYFGLEGRPGALWFSGRLECDYIDDLQDEYDDANDAAMPVANRRPRSVPELLNGVPLITRRRDGLEKNHPFAERLRAIVERNLRPLAEAEEKAASQKSGGANEDTKRRLRSAASQLGLLYQELARQQELEVDEAGGSTDKLHTPVTLMVIPDAATLTPDESKTFSIFAWPEMHEEGGAPDPPIATVRVALPEIATAENAGVALAIDKREPRRLRGTVKVTAQDRLDATTIEVTLGAYSAEAIIEVVEPDDPLPTNPPPRLVFKQDAYSMRVGRRRRLILWAPNDLVVPTGGAGQPPHALIHTNTSAIKCGSSAQLEQVETDDGQTWFQAEIEVEGAVAGAAKVRAEFGGQLAITRVTVHDPEGQNPFDFDLTARAPEYDSSGRAEWASVLGKRKLTIYAGHPSLRRYFGPNLENQNAQPCRILIAEVLADELAVDLLKREEKARAGTQLFPDLHSFDVRRRLYASKFLKAAHETLVPEATSDE